MASRTQKTERRRKHKNRAQGRRNKNERVARGTPKFPVHVEQVAAKTA